MHCAKNEGRAHNSQSNCTTTDIAPGLDWKISTQRSFGEASEDFRKTREGRLEKSKESREGSQTAWFDRNQRPPRRRHFQACCNRKREGTGRRGGYTYARAQIVSLTGEVDESKQQMIPVLPYYRPNRPAIKRLTLCHSESHQYSPLHWV